MRTGDHVHHTATGEDWIVAKVCDDGDIIPAGWPPTRVRANEVKLTAPCSDATHNDMVERLKQIDPSDPRHIPS